MYFRLIRNELGASKLITLTTTIFIAAAAMLVSLSAILVVNLTGAIDNLMTEARTPHFMQMHSGKLDTARFTAFAEQNDKIADFQVLDFLNIEGSRIVINGKTLAGSVQDNGFSMQSGKFDYLLDFDGKIVTPADGQLYAPVAYMKDGTARTGDTAVVDGKTFTIAGFVRDSQMNSLLASSKRFLVSAGDYAAIQHSGSTEYLIEFRLKDYSMIGAFTDEYTAAGLEANGPTLTYPLFRMLNAISDGLMIAVILLVSVLVVAIALLCIRFTLLAAIESDYREIGVMKAVGMRVSDLKKLYLAKYTVIAAAGCTLGYGISLAFKDLLLNNIRLSWGESTHVYLPLLVGITGVLLIFLAVTAYVSRVLRRFRSISAADAVRFGTPQEKAAGAKVLPLSGTRLLDTNLFLGIKDVLARKRLYGTMLAVLVISTFIIIVPLNLYHTISSPGFITYMGIGRTDLRLDLQQTGNIPGKAADIAKTMQEDRDIAKYTVLTTKSFPLTADGSMKRLKVELGDHSVFPVAYSSGRAPAAEDEIALSAMNAGELGLQAQDTLTLTVNRQKRALTVSGIYSDITNGGKTAKAVFTDNAADTMWSVIFAQLTDPSLVSGKVHEYAYSFNYAKVSDINEYITQTFGTTINSVKAASRMAMIVLLAVNILVTLLFMNLLIAKDRYSIAVMKACGFTNADLRTQYFARSLFVLLISIVLGTILANTLGELLAGALIASFGAASFTFIVHPLSAYVLCPLMISGSVLIATLTGTSGAGRIQISENIKE
ncbi:ABC transporter permease [Paenibacillus sp. MMS20-IR301]|uniref:ABC transporter permease n=1 Tax=Paenibacillus sp. MMS20-IR301 TaxID=2895946 RepID=UPI0028E5B4B6|nr:ABC transporter permease [Paenibacillus sp. MMS20-IR301]WNS41965.1 ABC transporter permease [Paenibacillus sp. MMS20-IR301]